MSSKILILENQKSQFDKMRPYLQDYEVYPKDYTPVMDFIRVFLTDERYTALRVKDAFDSFYDQFKDLGIDLIILDYKLTGCYEGRNGIYLAKELRETEAFRTVPIIFLSRTPTNDEHVKNEVNEVKYSVWVEKSYAGSDILNKVYFDKHVKKLIENMLGAPEFDIHLEMLDKLIKGPLLADYIDRLQALKNTAENLGSLTVDQKGIIFELSQQDSGDLTPSRIKSLIKKLNL